MSKKANYFQAIINQVNDLKNEELTFAEFQCVQKIDRAINSWAKETVGE